MNAYDGKYDSLKGYAEAVMQAQEKSVAHVMQEYLSKSMRSLKGGCLVRSQSFHDLSESAQVTRPRSQSDACTLDTMAEWSRPAISWDSAQNSTVIGKQLILGRAMKVGATDSRLIPLQQLNIHTDRTGCAIVKVQMTEDARYLRALLKERQGRCEAFIDSLKQYVAAEATANSL